MGWIVHYSSSTNKDGFGIRLAMKVDMPLNKENKADQKIVYSSFVSTNWI